ARYSRVVPGKPVIFSSAAGNAIALADPDAAPLDAAWDLDLSVPSGTLTLAKTNGLVGTGNGTGTLHYRGTVADLNAALEGLRYDPPAGLHGKVFLSIVAQSEAATTLQAVVVFTDGEFTVTTTADSGEGSLRQAILDTDATPGATTIAFAI